MNAADEHIQNQLRSIPALGQLLETPDVVRFCDRYGGGVVKTALRNALQKSREAIISGDIGAFSLDKVILRLEGDLERLCNPLRRQVLNASGILLHTGIGRAALSDAALAAIEGAGRYTLLQTDIDSGERSLREEKIEWMLCELTGCEAATVVNNNAAATMLSLNTLSAGRETIISRGQLIEIGGAFRMPDVMQMSNALMAEVGTTNKTHLKDYRMAFNPETTAALIHVHTSNYRVRGFGSTPEIRQLAPLAKELGIYAIDDLGSGALTSLSEWGLPNEPLVSASLAAGADIACFSGDKLIGGPQCGIICGRKNVIGKIRKNPFARMFRVCKLTLAALEATLVIWLNDRFRQEIPFYQMLGKEKRVMLDEAALIVDSVSDIFEIESGIIQSAAYVGSGSIPDETVPSVAVRINLKGRSCNALAARLRAVGVFGRIRDEALLLEMITLLPGQAQILAQKLRQIFDSEAKGDSA